MNDFRLSTQSRTGAAGRAAVDAGLRSYMLRVYNYMALGVAWTAVVTLFMTANPQLMATIAMGYWVLFFAIMGLGMFAPRLIFSGNATSAYLAYGAYATLWGLFISPVIDHYMHINGGALIFRALLITSITFGATSLAGYVTKKDLSGFAGFFMMASIGLIVAIVVNAIFFQFTMGSLITSILVVLLFSGITAWETQQIKAMYVAGDIAAAARSKAIFGAFMLYGSFITLFIHILNILGIMNNN